MDTFQLPATTKMGYVHLQTANTDRLLSFYVHLLGFTEVKRESKTVFLAAHEKASPLIMLTENKNAVPRSRQSPGLFHAAFLLPARIALARLLKRLMENNIRLGFGDHGVSEAIYLSDPDGNAVELYADRPREQWPLVNGKVEMYTAPVDTISLLNEFTQNPQAWTRIDPDTRIGHIHLQVSDLAKAENFYHHMIGFDVMQRSYPGALFVSAGGYHHHLGLNTWNSHNVPLAPLNSSGLLSFSIVLPDTTAMLALKNQMENSGSIVSSSHSGLEVRDSDGMRVCFQVI